MFALLLIFSDRMNAEAKENTKYLFIGDSRFVGMSTAVTDADDVDWICKVDEEDSWILESEQWNKIKKYPKSTSIIYGFGVNNLEQSDDNIKGLKKLINTFDRVYFNYVGPVDEKIEKKYKYTIKNKNIESFNNYIVNKGLEIKEINSYRFLTELPFDTGDGLHYTSSTYKEQYKFIRSEIEDYESFGTGEIVINDSIVGKRIKKTDNISRINTEIQKQTEFESFMNKVITMTGDNFILVFIGVVVVVWLILLKLLYWFLK